MWCLNMKNGIKVVIAIIALLIAPTIAEADQMTHKFKSPSFSGINTSSHYLTIENQETNRKKELQAEIQARLDELEREEENSTINKFLRNFESRIYSRLSKELVESLFEGGALGDDFESRFYFTSEDYYIRYYMLDGRLIMETYPGKYGEDGTFESCEESDLCTQIEVPVDQFNVYGDDG